MDDYIGAFSFHYLSFFGIGYKPSIMFETRYGVDDVIVWEGDNRGEQFTVDTEVLVADLATGQALVDSYEAVIGNTYNWGVGGIDRPLQVTVKNVVAAPNGVIKIVNGLDDLGNQYRALVQASWTLLTRNIARV